MANDEENVEVMKLGHSVGPKPGKLPSDPRAFEDWKFDVENFMCVVHPSFGEEMELATSTALGDGEELGHGEAGSPLRKRSALLYGVLAGLTTGRAKLMVKTLRSSKNGYQVWRQLCDDYMPKSSQGLKLAMALELSHGKEFEPTADFQSALLKWEEKIRQYEQLGSAFDSTLKKAIILKFAPEPLGNHMRVTPGATDSYESMRSSIESYYRSVGKWCVGDMATGDDPMDIGAFGDRDGKGKGKGKPVDVGCSRCGSTKHQGWACKHWQSTCRVCGRQGHLSMVCRAKDKGKGKGGDHKGDGGKGKGKPAKGKGDGKGKGKGKDGKGKGDVAAVQEDEPEQVGVVADGQDWVLGVTDGVARIRCRGRLRV